MPQIPLEQIWLAVLGVTLVMAVTVFAFARFCAETTRRIEVLAQVSRDRDLSSPSN